MIKPMYMHMRMRMSTYTSKITAVNTLANRARAGGLKKI